MPDREPPDSMWPKSIQAYDLTLPTTAKNLGLDEALLAAVEDDPSSASLRFWQPEEFAVVIGRSNRVETEVNMHACSAAGIPILRRATGGGTVLIGPGCLCYTLALPLSDMHRARGVSGVTQELMTRTASGLRDVLAGIEVNGTSDLCLNGLKFSGNAQRWLRNAFIHHGTLLFNTDLTRIERYLAHPTREPAYRKSRSHADFVTNVNLPLTTLKNCLNLAWCGVPAECPTAIQDEASKISTTRYSSDDWYFTPQS